jgi:glycosyltransferase involved in cell wall biosynthesis
MSISIITFADLGRRSNLKTIGIMPVINTFLQSGELVSIACRTNDGFSFKDTRTVLPFWMRCLIKGVEWVTFKVVSSRQIEEYLFDYWAASAIKPADMVLFHPEYFFKKSICKIKRGGGVTIGIATMAHLSTNARLEHEEQVLLGIKKPFSLYRSLFASNSHLNDFDYIVAYSDFVKESYIEAGFPKENIFVAVPDIDSASFSIERKIDNMFRVIYVAHTSVLKGLHYLLDAWQDANLKNAELVIIGGFDRMADELVGRYKESIAKDATILFMENLNRAQVIEQYTQATVCVLPSITEGSSKVVLEAMASGIPVITTTNAQGLVIDGVSGFVVPIRNAQIIREKLEWLHSHRHEAATMGNEARRALEIKKSFGQAVFEIYESIKRKKNI